MATINGTSGDDILIGTAGADTINGLGGQDLIVDGLGNDILDGGAGIDSVSYAGASGSEQAILGLADGINAGSAIGADGRDTLRGIENVRGSAFDDVIIGNSGSNGLNGGGGSDFIDGGQGDDQIQGEEGHDFIEGGLGNDILIGGGGIDTVSYADASGGVIIFLGSADGLTSGRSEGADGTDLVQSIENVAGSAFDDIIVGNGGDNVLEGLGGDDQFAGGLGNDTIDGGEGNDTVDYGFAETNVVVDLKAGTAEGDGSDKLIGIENVVGSDFGDTLTGEDGANILSGGLGNDALIGGFGADALLGQDDNDLLDGGDGVGSLSGGIGDDHLIGGLGDDFIFAEIWRSAVDATHDLLDPADRAAVDRILLESAPSTTVAPHKVPTHAAHRH